MGRNIKIELELPEFEKELNISVTLRKDGEVLCTSSTPTEIKTNINESPTSLPFPGQRDNSPVWNQYVEDLVQELILVMKNHPAIMLVGI